MTRERYNFIMEQPLSYYKSDNLTDEEREFILKYFLKEPDKFEEE